MRTVFPRTNTNRNRSGSMESSMEERNDLLAESAATGNNILATPAHNFDLTSLSKTRTFSEWQKN
jgi:hypothetical protein